MIPSKLLNLELLKLEVAFFLIAESAFVLRFTNRALEHKLTNSNTGIQRERHRGEITDFQTLFIINAGLHKTGRDVN